MSDDFIPDSQFVPDRSAPAANIAMAQPAQAPGFIPDAQFQSDEDKYGGTGQQLVAGLEGAARGATLGGSDYLEQKLLGVDPKDILGRKNENPVSSTVGNIAGSIGLTGLTGGLAAPVEGALGAGLAAKAIGYGAEGAVFGAGNAVSDYSLGDPNLNAQKVVADVGLGALLGAGIGVGAGALGNVFGGKVADIAAKANDSAEAAEALSSTSGSGEASAGGSGAGSSGDASSNSLFKGLNPQKDNVQDIVNAGAALGAPVTEGMTSNSKWVQQAEDALVNGAPTYSGIRRAKILSDGYQAVTDKLGQVLDTGDQFGGGAMTKAELGESLQNSLSNKIAQDSAPINDMYEALKPHMETIPVDESAASKVGKDILALKEVRVDPSSPQGALGTRIAKALDNLDNVDDLKYLKSSISKSLSPVASGEEKHMAGTLADMLSDLENKSIEGAASDPSLPPETQDTLKGLIDQRKAADAAYAPFKENLNTLLEQLGRKNIGGAQSAIDHINSLDPEALANKLFDKKFSKFNEFFQEKFPSESALMKQYQKQMLREAASKTGEFSPKVFFNKVNELQPEIQKSIFAPDELQTIKHAETWIRALPKNFNPSGTSGMSAFRSFFESPTGAAIANARDFGIEGFLKAAGSLPENLRPNPNPYEVGAELADKFNKLTAVQSIADQADQKISENAKAIFDKTASLKGAALSAAAQLSDKGYDHATKGVKNLADNPNGMMDHLVQHTEGLSNSLPNITQGIHQTAVAGTQFLKSKIPQPANNLPFSQKDWQPSQMQKQTFMRYYNAVNDPISVLKDVKQGTLTNQALEALTAVHPLLLQQMRQQVASGLQTENTRNMSYGTKISVAKFLGHPLDDQMLPQVLAANQTSLSGPQLGQNSAPKQGARQRGSLGKLDLSNLKATQTRDSPDDTK